MRTKPDQPVLFWGVLVAVCIATPFAIVGTPPLVDLPQHAAQIVMFGDALSGDPTWSIHPFTPYLMSYVVMGGFMASLGARAGAVVAAVFVAIAWALSLFLIARRNQRPLSSAALASLFVFSSLLAWGFLNFLLGWPLFVLWFLALERESESPRERVLVLVLGALLAMAHVLWFAVGLGWLLTTVRRVDRSVFAWRVAAVLPIIVVLAIWYPSLASEGFDGQTRWITTPLQRLEPSWLIASCFGALQWTRQLPVALAVVCWIGLGLVGHWGALSERIDRRLLLLAVFLGLMALLLPDNHNRTIRFAARWAPHAGALAVLALPAPRLSPRLRAALVVVVLGLSTSQIASAWHTWRVHDLDPMFEVSKAIPDDGGPIMGLDFRQYSRFVAGRPTMHAHVWLQVERGLLPHFSFASHAVCPVHWAAGGPPWGDLSGVSWLPETLSPDDLVSFGHLVVRGKPGLHDELAGYSWLEPLSRAGEWAVYRVGDQTEVPSGRIDAAPPK